MTNVEFHMTKLTEMVDAIDQSLDNIEKVTREQKNLIEVLESQTTFDFSELIEETKKQVEDIEKQVPELKSRREKISKALDACEESLAYREIISVLLEGLGWKAEE